MKWANTADEEMDGMNASSLGDTVEMPNGFHSKKTAILRNTYKTDLGSYAFGKDATAQVKLAKYGLNDITFTSQNSKDGLAIFADIYYALGWKAFVDGKETPIYKANYVLRAIKVPAGSHTINFVFHPNSFYTAKNISLVCSLLLIGLCIVALLPVFKKGKDNKLAEA